MTPYLDLTTFLVYAKAWIVAVVHAVGPTRASYSQSDDDRIVERLLGGMPREGEIYVDVGANHPTRLSNTYRYYRRGFSGIVIEPNRILMRIHSVVRPRDTRLPIGCGETPGVFHFRHAASHVLSGFDNVGSKASEFRRGEWVPVLQLDTVLEGIGTPDIFLLSIDVEGLDKAVARGATRTLRRTRLVVIEGTPDDSEALSFFREQGFDLAATSEHNLFFRRIGVGPADVAASERRGPQTSSV